jgi:hypothetical protein
MGRIKKPKHGPEWYIQRDLMTYMRARGWLVERMTGNMYQKGIPDLYCHHPQWGERWIDVKNDGKYSFTDDQKKKWPVWERAKVGIWILVAATQTEYDKLFAPPNFRDYWKPSWDREFNIDKLLAELRAEADEE